MTVLLVLCALMVALAIAWGLRRRSETLAWNRELDLAFGVSARRELPAHRAL
jgi:hypothetical protein